MPDLPERKLASGKQVYKTYMRHVRPYSLYVFLTLLAGIGVQITDLAAPWYLRRFFNLLGSGSRDAEVIAALFSIIIVVSVIWSINWVMHRIRDFTSNYFASRVMADLYSSAFSYLIRHSYNFFISNFAGSLTHRVSKFTRAFEVISDSIVLQFIPMFVFVTGAIAVLFTRNAMLGWMLLIWSIVFTVFQTWVAKLWQPIRRARSAADTRVTGSLADSISNHPTVMLFSGAGHEHGLFKGVVDLWRKAVMRSWIADSLVWSALGILMLIIEIGLMWGATVYWSSGLLEIGDFVLIQAYLLSTFDRLLSINRELRRFYDAFADAQEMVAMLELSHGIQDMQDAKPLRVEKGEVAFNNVSFYFDPDRPILRNYYLVIRGGERIALVGPSGAGKSTVTKLLLRMFNIQEGSIEIDRQNIASVKQESLRRAIAYVPQEPILFHRTLMENIRYGRRDATDEEVVEAAKKAHCHEFVSTLPLGYATYVGERGVKLSGGERQRVAIARAILKNAPILVLDEATSSLDSESEHLIQDALENLMRDKTVMVIAHRLSTIMKMDRIIVMENGRIVSEGTHDELLLREGLYQKLWSIQAGGFTRHPTASGVDTGAVPPVEMSDYKESSQEPVPREGSS